MNEKQNRPAAPFTGSHPLFPKLALFCTLAAGLLLTSCSFSMVGDVAPPAPLQAQVQGQAQATPLPAAAGLFVERAHVFLSAPNPGRLQVEEMISITNPGSQPVKALPGQPALQVDLPSGAQNLNFLQDAASFQAAPNGFSVTRDIPPGADPQPIIFSYEMPYSGDLSLGLKFPLLVKAALLTTPGSELQVSGSQLGDMGEQTVQGMRLHFYGVGSLPSGEALRVQISSGSTSWLVDNSGTTSLSVGLAAFLLALGVVFWRSRR